ncbi:Uncharacterised protein [Serratia quinivorans]|uniref:hypothetical protein n=1 Tax=Serratia quinivorans TaxID=137545 RepID=UPI002178BAF2|nr:hypothetical protein [Serratia quinivorans]CAI1722219.1 Uncharacterised protein [Serratia quinivorans]
MKRHLLLATLLIGAASSVNAETAPNIKGWTFLASNNDTLFYGKNDSVQHVNGASSAIIQQIPSSDYSNKGVNYTKFSVSDKDCKVGLGSVNIFNLSDKLIAKVDYVNGGNSVAAAIADIICGVYNSQ